MADQPTTPLMGQYFQVKQKYPDAILLFRVGDFYETFGEDAVKTSRALGIVCTARNNGGSNLELAGFPYHAMDIYLPRLVRAGYRVAVCEQMEKPSPGKKILRREVTEVVTPGVTTEDSLLDTSSNNYLATVVFGKKDQFGVAFLDISTGEFLVSEGDESVIDKLLGSFRPSEVIVARSQKKAFFDLFGDKFYVNTLEDWAFAADNTREKLLTHFQTTSMKGFGIEEFDLAQTAAGAALQYLNATENTRLAHVNSVSRVQTDRFVWLDRFTIRNLELLSTPGESGTPLISILDQTISPMGARMLKKWVLLPLTNHAEIIERQEIVSFFIENQGISEVIEPQIRQIGDLERIMSKVSVGKINPREVGQLNRALAAIEPIKDELAATGAHFLQKISESLNPCRSLRDRITRDLVAEPPVAIQKGGAIADGSDAELDELRSIVKNSQAILLEIQQREITRTGINSLKIGFTGVFGYYLEVTNKYKEQVPPEWIRKQTISTGERYITEELKILEAKILGAEDKMQAIEERIFARLVEEISLYMQPIQSNAQLIAQLDCLLSFHKIALKNNYCRPEIDDSFAIDIKDGRHPVIEKQLAAGENFVPNDVFLDNESQQIMMITGPNMAGKSALLRQTALIVLMAQMGSFVPAKHAKIGLIDKIFTRVGASDNISSGESTFMVEMNETASILNNISNRSLILLDEIGRGTSTYDGISIAWSIAEYLHQHEKSRAKTLFATHYHELNELADKFERVQNYHVSTKEVGQKIIFLRKLTAGGSNHSFGIHVARLAGMPRLVIDRANEILAQLEEKHIDEDKNDQKLASVNRKRNQTALKNMPQKLQLSIFESDEYTIKIKEELMKLDLNTMTPMDALWKLNELRRIADK
jgi:DNA mismatch repair protein MutS